ncbi:MAG: hypothetical protein ACJ768_02655 [Gaiellaceae bacterium]
MSRREWFYEVRVVELGANGANQIVSWAVEAASPSQATLRAQLAGKHPQLSQNNAPLDGRQIRARRFVRVYRYGDTP